MVVDETPQGKLVRFTPPRWGEDVHRGPGERGCASRDPSRQLYSGARRNFGGLGLVGRIFLEGLPPLPSGLPSGAAPDRLVSSPAPDPQIAAPRIESDPVDQRRVRGMPPSTRRLGVPRGNVSGSTRCLCGCGEMVSGSRKFKFGHRPEGGLDG